MVVKLLHSSTSSIDVVRWRMSSCRDDFLRNASFFFAFFSDSRVKNAHHILPCTAVIDAHLPRIRSMDGLESIHRIACGECHEFKLIVTLHESDFAIWECDSFTFESDVLKQMEAIEGATKVETQTYTFTDLTKEENKERLS